MRKIVLHSMYYCCFHGLSLGVVVHGLEFPRTTARSKCLQMSQTIECVFSGSSSSPRAIVCGIFGATRRSLPHPRIKSVSTTTPRSPQITGATKKLKYAGRNNHRCCSTAKPYVRKFCSQGQARRLFDGQENISSLNSVLLYPSSVAPCGRCKMNRHLQWGLGGFRGSLELKMAFSTERPGHVLLECLTGIPVQIVLHFLTGSCCLLT